MGKRGLPRRMHIHLFFQTLKLGKTKTDMCNDCFNLKLKISDPETSLDEKLRLKAKLSVHMGESNTQIRAMNSYIQLVKKRLPQNDPSVDDDPI